MTTGQWETTGQRETTNHLQRKEMPHLMKMKTGQTPDLNNTIGLIWCVDCKSSIAQGFFCLGSLSRGTQLKMISSDDLSNKLLGGIYGIHAWDSAMGNLGWWNFFNVPSVPSTNFFPVLHKLGIKGTLLWLELKESKTSPFIRRKAFEKQNYSFPFLYNTKLLDFERLKNPILKKMKKYYRSKAWTTWKSCLSFSFFS